MKKDYIDEMILKAVSLDDIELLIFVLSRLSKDVDKSSFHFAFNWGKR